MRHLITKGAFATVLEACTRTAAGEPLDAEPPRELEARLRGLGPARASACWRWPPRRWRGSGSYARDDERELSFVGFLTFVDRPKEGVRGHWRTWPASGCAVKLITGDSKLVAQHVADAVGMRMRIAC